MIGKKRLYVATIFTAMLIPWLSIPSIYAVAAPFSAQSPMPDVPQSYNSPFGNNPTREAHNGVDLGPIPNATNSQPFWAMASGKVTKVISDCTVENNGSDSCGGWRGNLVVVETTGDWDGMKGPTPLGQPRDSWAFRPKGNVSIFYQHIAHGSIKVKEGDSVKVGQEIGKIGSTGSSSGPHLHISMYQRSDSYMGGSDANSVDPEPYMSTPGVSKYTWPPIQFTPPKGEKTFEGSSSGSDGGSKEPDIEGVMGMNMRGMPDPLMFFEARNIDVNTLGISTKSEYISPNFVGTANKLSDKVLQGVYILASFASVTFFAYLALVSISYFVLFPRGTGGYKLLAKFEKFTGLDSTFTRDGALSLILADIVGVLMVSVILSGVYVPIMSFILNLIGQIF